jgi:PAS domain S-box-containing protein
VPGGYISNRAYNIGKVCGVFSAVILIMLLYNCPLLSSTVSIGESGFPVNISQSLEYLEDKNGEFTPDQIREKDFSAWRSGTADIINFGYTRSAYWFKFTLEDVRVSPGRLLLEIDFSTLDYVDFYYPGSRGGYEVIRTGDRRPFFSREIADSKFVFSVNPVSGNDTFYLRIDNGGSLRFRPLIYSDSSFLENRNQYLPIFWFIYGILMFSVVFYFLLFIYLRDIIYIYFSLFTLSLILYQISFRGFAFQFLWPSYPDFGNIVTLLLPSFIGIFSALFLRNILNTRSTNRVLHVFFSLFGFLIFPVLAVLSLFLPYHTAALMRYYTLLIYGLLILPSVAYYMKKGNRFARYFLSGFVILMMTNVVTTLMVLDIIPATRFIEWSNDLGFILIILFSSVGLVDRFKTTTVDLLDSQKSLSEKNRMLILANEELAATNEELEAINEEFEAQNRELMESEKSLAASEMEMKDIFNSTHDAFIIHDHNGVILDVNKRMLAMYNVSREEALLMSVIDISSTSVDAAVRAGYLERVMAGEELLFEWKAMRPVDRSEFYAEVGLKKLFWRNRDVILATIRDLTERKTSENERELVRNQLVQAQKMEAVGTLAGGIAHDFNNVLGGIIGSLKLVELLIRKEKIQNESEIYEYLETAVESSIRAADMTKQLLTLSRKSELKMKPVLIQSSLKHVMNICRSSFPKSVELDFRYDDSPLFIHADPSQIDQSILNLCVNASHAMTLMRNDSGSSGGRLTVTAGVTQFDHLFCSLYRDASPGIPYVMISVEDNGVGITEDVSARIFEPFFTTKPQDKGTGLGLSMTYSIIKQHGGFITVNSEPGRGSVFTLYLPEIDQDQSVISEKRSELITGTGLILVIDDEEAILRVTAGMLKKCGYDVVTAAKPDQGIDFYRNDHGNISVVILDNSMPEMSGIEVYKALENINPGVKVILCSGFIDDSSLQKALDMGITGFMSKPYSFEELSHKLKEIIG